MITELKRLRARGLNLLHLKKIFLYPILYFRGASYNNEKYWSNRHKKYQDQHLATGDEGLSESENIKRSKLISDSIVSILKKHDIKAETLLDIGTGIGATLRPLASYLAPKKIIGTDIAQVNPQNIQNCVHLSDVSQKIISKPFALRRSLHKPGNVKEINGRIYFFLGILHHS